ncbi:ABC transporter permease [Bacillus sp. H-16]|uniref:ABC transporter permease n=1 Tax=Alteribacter salitolerans TaxID=2912333 RepID=UPI0019643A5E|nr:ABC transporter permease [Alteribacter salitolerans]MBM7094340.1 ABC transporter permease [Alteribacter salitolerans]
MSWLMLLKKELRQNTFVAGLNLALLLVILVFLWYQVDRNPGNTMFIFLLIPVVFFHLFYVFIVILVSMRREWKEGTALLWMNLPHRGWKLLSAKLASAFILFTASLLITMTSLYALLLASRDAFIGMGIPDFSSLYLEYFGWIFAFITHGALWLGLTGLFIYVLSKVIKPLGWLLGIGISIGLNIVWSWVNDTALYTGIAQWIPLLKIDNIPEGIELEMEGLPVNAQGSIEVLYLSQVIIEFGLLTAAFAGICWLFDKKAEV